jgi:hypothetical protein
LAGSLTREPALESGTVLTLSLLKSQGHLLLPQINIDACIFLMENHNGNEIVNIGSGREITIGELARKMKRIVGYGGGN